MGRVNPYIRGEIVPPLRAVAELAGQQHGVVSREQLRRLGLSDGVIDRLISKGWLHPIHRGVYAVGHARLTRRGEWMGAVLTGGRTALLSHRTAAALHGLLGWRASWPVDVAVIRGGGRVRPGIAIHRPRGLHPDDRTQGAGIPVTGVARTLLDLATYADRRMLANAFEEADRARILSYAALTQLIQRSRGHHGLKLLRHAMRHHTWPDPHTRTEFEHAFVRLCDSHGIPRPHSNVQIGPYTVDALWPESKLIVELDGRTGHDWPAAAERDRVRDAELQLGGYMVIRVTWRRLHDTPEELAAQIRRAAQRRPLETAI